MHFKLSGLHAFWLSGIDRGFSLRTGLTTGRRSAVTTGLQVAIADADADADADASADQPRCHGAIDYPNPRYAVQPFV